MNEASAIGAAERDVKDVAQFAADVRYYLAQMPRQLPSQYFYDELGSVLFEAICRLPWYGITRAESRLLTAHAPDVFRRLRSLTTIVELGPGSGEKLRLLLEGASARRDALDVHLVDVSAHALHVSAQTLGTLSGVRVTTHQATYDAGLRVAAAQAHGEALVAFLGSNLGNFDPPGAAAFLHNMRTGMSAGDALLLGLDLVKPERTLIAAYDDPLGITAAFNRNLLVRINRELDADFDVYQFAHRAVWNTAWSRVEMHLVARQAQDIHVTRAAVSFRMNEGEPIWTESSYKYHPDEIAGMLASCGFRQVELWIDVQDGFALTLAEAV